MIGLRAVCNICPWPLRSWTGSRSLLLQILFCTGLCVSLPCFFFFVTRSAQSQFSIIYSGYIMVQIVYRCLPGIQILNRPPWANSRSAKKLHLTERKFEQDRWVNEEKGEIKIDFHYCPLLWWLKGQCRNSSRDSRIEPESFCFTLNITMSVFPGLCSLYRTFKGDEYWKLNLSLPPVLSVPKLCYTSCAFLKSIMFDSFFF